MKCIQFNTTNFKECLSFIGSSFDNSHSGPNVITAAGLVDVCDGDIIVKDDGGSLYVASLKEPTVKEETATAGFMSYYMKAVHNPGILVDLPVQYLRRAKVLIEKEVYPIHITWVNDKYYLFHRERV